MNEANKPTTEKPKITAKIDKEKAYNQIHELALAFINTGKSCFPIKEAIDAFKEIYSFVENNAESK